MFVSLAKGRSGGEEKFTCLLCNLCLASGPELLCCWFGVNQMSQSQEPGPGLSQVRFLLAAVQERCPTRICGVEGACCVRAAEVVSRHIPPDTAWGCSGGKEGCSLISLESLALETAENNSVPLCQAAPAGFFLEMEAFRVTADFSRSRGDSARTEAQTR